MEIQDISAKLASHFEDEISDIGLESPIENLMAAGLLLVFRSYHFDYDGYLNGMYQALPFGSFEELRAEDSTRAPGFLIHPQFPIGRYRGDFFIDFVDYRGARHFAVIECDGHDFHERTKKQAQHDKKRDRYFQSLGLIVLRYTGSEIFRDPVECASGAIKLIDDRARAHWRGCTV